MPVGPNLGLSRDGIRFLDPVQAARNPASWLARFRPRSTRGRRSAEEALSCIQQHVDRYRADDFFPQAGGPAALLAVAEAACQGSTPGSREMHDCGLLGRVFPEFQAISWRVVRDFYHKYTVDEHTLLTIRNLERLADGDRRIARGSSRLLAGLARARAAGAGAAAARRRQVARRRPRARKRADGAKKCVERLQLAGEQRDIGPVPDSPSPADVARRVPPRHRGSRHRPAASRRLVGTEERLKMLCLMTLVDVEAVSPETLTPWKEELLWRLYVDTYNHLTQRLRRRADRAEPGGTRSRRCAGRPDDIVGGRDHAVPRGPAAAVSAAVPPRRDLPARPAGARHPAGRSARCRSSASDRLWELAVVTLDKPFLFSNICGVLSSFGMNILRGHAMTNPNGLVLDVFQFTDDERFLELNARRARRRCCTSSRTSCPGATDVTQRLARP